MAGDTPRAADPVAFGGGVLDRYRHVCAFVNDPGEVDAVLDPFVRDAVDRGDRLLYLVDAAAAAAPVNRLRHLGFDVGRLLAERRCEVRSWADTYLRGGSFDQESMLAMLDRILLDRDAPLTRMICDMGWATGVADVNDSLIEFEAKANFIHAQHDHVVICSYDVNSFDGGFIIDVMRTHPMVLIGGVLQQNPFFVPPSEFLRERRERARR